MLLINIPEPCHENWNEMSPREQGAFCNVCSKTVIDFTSLSDEEVKNYFLANQGQKTCGRFKNSQLTNNDNPLPALLAGNLPLWKKFLAAVVILFGSFLTGCNEPTLGKMSLSEKETENTFVGITLTELSCEIEEPKTEEFLVTKGFTMPIIVGEPEIIQTDVVGLSELHPDTVLNIKPETQKTDSIKKIPVKDDCDSTSTDPITFNKY